MAQKIINFLHQLSYGGWVGGNLIPHNHRYMHILFYTVMKTKKKKKKKIKTGSNSHGQC
jgi:hypothetical protein